MDESSALDMLAALAQPSRLAAYRLMVRHAPVGLPAGEIARQLGIPQNTLSAHLRILHASGLALPAREGRVVRYGARLDAFRGLIRFLMDDCCHGRVEICAPLVAELACGTSSLGSRQLSTPDRKTTS